MPARGVSAEYAPKHVFDPRDVQAGSRASAYPTASITRVVAAASMMSGGERRMLSDDGPQRPQITRCASSG
jgi:hypothetical protein